MRGGRRPLRQSEIKRLEPTKVVVVKQREKYIGRKVFEGFKKKFERKKIKPLMSYK